MSSDPVGAPALRPEAELIESARAGDEVAFGELVTLHGDQIYGALRRFGLGPADAEDVAQEVFLRAWRSLDRFQGRSQLSTWLYRIAFNEAHRRLARIEPAGPMHELDGEDPVASLPDAPSTRPAAQALDREFETMLAAALSALPEDWRTAVILRDLEGLPSRDAARVVGVRDAAFKSRLHRGRMQLRGLLEPYLDLDAA